MKASLLRHTFIQAHVGRGDKHLEKVLLTYTHTYTYMCMYRYVDHF